MKTHSLAFTIIIFSIPFALFAQSGPSHEKRIYEDKDGKVFINKSQPVYLSISTSADGSDGKVLKGQDPKYSYPMYLDTEGYNSIRSPWKVNPETREALYPKEEVVFEVYADGTPPKTNITLKAKNKFKENDVWMINGREVELTAQDALSGVEDIFYSVDNAAYQAYRSPIELKEDKLYSIKYYAVDLVGNLSEPVEIKVQPELSAPSTTLAIIGDQFEKNVSARTTFTLASKDDISGVSKTFYQIDNGTTYSYSQPIPLSSLSEGEHTLTYFSVDKVENREEEKSYAFYVDKSAPKVISEVIGNTFFANGKEYYSGRTKLKLVAMDNKAGVKEIRYAVNGGEYQEYTAPFYLTEAGSLNITVQMVDNVSNSAKKEEFSDNNSLRAFVDLSGPELDFKISGASFTVKDTIILNMDTKINLIGKDSESGFKEMDYQLNDGALQTYTAPFSIENEGLYTITFNGYDQLQNSNTKSILVRVDNSGPAIFTRFSVASNKYKVVADERLPVYPAHAILFLSATDKYSGIDEINYQVNGGALLPYKSTIQGFQEGTAYTIKAEVKDKLGNVSTEEIKFFIE